MKKTEDYLYDLLKMYPEIRNDSELAERIGITRAAVSNYRSGQSMSVYVAVRVAELLNIEPMETISVCMHERAKTKEEIAYWLKWYKKAGIKKGTRQS